MDKGVFDIYIAPDRAKIVSANGFEIIAAAPDWTPHCFRRSTKMEFITPMMYFSGIAMGNPWDSGGVTQVQVVPRGKGTVQGLTYKSFSIRHKPKSLLAGSDQIVTDPRVVEFITRFYHMPNPGPVPLFFITDKGQKVMPKTKADIQLCTDIGNDYRSGLAKELELISWKREPFRKADFALPVNFRRTKEMGQVTFSEQQKDELDQVINGIGFKSESGKN